MYCQQLAPVLEQVLRKYPQEVKIVFKNYPIQRHKFSAKAAAAALAAQSFGKFWEYHDRLFDKDVFGKLSDEKFVEIAKELGLDTKTFEARSKDPETLARVRRDALEGRDAGVRGTPTVFINGRQLKKMSLAGLHAEINQELVRLRKKP